MSHHHHAGLALSLSCLLRFLSTNPFSLSLKHALTRPSCAHHHHHAIHPVCVVCVLWGWTAPSTTVVVKHATHTLVDHCVDGSHHPTLHPPSTLTPFCAFATTNHHAIPLLQPPPPPQGHCAHPLPTLLPHTHTWCGWHVPLWLLSRPVCGVCGWHAHPITSSTHTQPQPLWLCPSPHHHSLVCVCAWKHVPHGHAQPPTTHLHGVVFSLSSQVRAIKPFAIHPVCVCGGLVVGLCWCGHLCECLCVGWLCCFPPHCVSCVPPCPHPSVSPHSLALVLLLLVVIGGG